MTDAAWYERFFGDDYLNVYEYQFNAERAEREAAFAVEALSLKPGESLLDLCSGPGRHSLLLAGQGLTVTALDLSQAYLDQAEAAARAQGVTLETLRADMRDLPWRDRFDAVINMFSSFGYLESEAEDAKVLAAVQRSLKPGGRALFDLLNREWVIANQAPQDGHTGDDGVMYLEHREFDYATSRNHVTFTAVARDGTYRELDGHHIRLYTLREMIAMLTDAGLEFDRAYGGYEGEAYDATTRRMIIVARKP